MGRYRTVWENDTGGARRLRKPAAGNKCDEETKDIKAVITLLYIICCDVCFYHTVKEADACGRIYQLRLGKPHRKPAHRRGGLQNLHAVRHPFPEVYGCGQAGPLQLQECLAESGGGRPSPAVLYNIAHHLLAVSRDVQFLVCGGCQYRLWRDDTLCAAEASAGVLRK